MTELEALRQKRSLVILSAQLQRATMLRRMERLQANPARRFLGLAALAVRRPAVMTLGTAAARFALRAWKRRRSKRNEPIH